MSETGQAFPDNDLAWVLLRALARSFIALITGRFFRSLAIVSGALLVTGGASKIVGEAPNNVASDIFLGFEGTLRASPLVIVFVAFSIGFLLPLASIPFRRRLSQRVLYSLSRHQWSPQLEPVGTRIPLIRQMKIVESLAAIAQMVATLVGVALVAALFSAWLPAIIGIAILITSFVGARPYLARIVATMHSDTKHSTSDGGVRASRAEKALEDALRVTRRPTALWRATWPYDLLYFVLSITLLTAWFTTDLTSNAGPAFGSLFTVLSVGLSLRSVVQIRATTQQLGKIIGGSLRNHTVDELEEN